jgi:tetratricopeptide (TPR) repeat protein
MQLGGIALCQGRQAEGKALLRHFIATFKTTEERVNLPSKLDIVGETCVDLAKFSEALFLYGEAAQVLEELGDHRGLALARLRLGETEGLMGHYEKATSHLRAALTLAQETNERHIRGLSIMNLGWVYLGQTRCVDAQEQLLLALSIYHGMEHQWFVETCSAFLAHASLGLGRRGDAEEYLRVALGSAARAGQPGPIWKALCAVALLRLADGEVEEAVELQTLLSRYPVLSKAQFYEDIVWQHVRTAAADLPPDVVTAARERGQTRDLETTALELLEELGRE